MRVYLVDLDGILHDLRGQVAGQQPIYHGDNYTAGQHLARTLREVGSNGLPMTASAEPEANALPHSAHRSCPTPGRKGTYAISMCQHIQLHGLSGVRIGQWRKHWQTVLKIVLN